MKPKARRVKWSQKADVRALANNIRRGSAFCKLQINGTFLQPVADVELPFVVSALTREFSKMLDRAIAQIPLTGVHREANHKKGYVTSINL